MVRTKKAGWRGEKGRNHRESVREAAREARERNGQSPPPSRQERKRCRDEAVREAAVANGLPPPLSKREKKRLRDEEDSAKPSAETAAADASLPPAKKSKTQSTDNPASDPLDSEDETLLSPSNVDSYPAEFGNLLGTHDITAMTIISSSKMEKKITKILGTLSSFTFAAPCKPNVVFLQAKSQNAAKLISIVELVKRTLQEKGTEWYQYNCLEKKLASDARKTAGSGDEARDEEAGDEHGGFETMKTPLERALDGRPVVNGQPFMSVCLSRLSVQGLKDIYGEQTNAAQ